MRCRNDRAGSHEAKRFLDVVVKISVIVEMSHLGPDAFPNAFQMIAGLERRMEITALRARQQLDGDDGHCILDHRE